MGNGRFFRILSILWLGFAAACLLGHYAVDAFSIACQTKSTQPCWEQDINSDAQLQDNNWGDGTLLHAGYRLPTVASIILDPRPLLPSELPILLPRIIKLPVFSPPPK